MATSSRQDGVTRGRTRTFATERARLEVSAAINQWEIWFGRLRQLVDAAHTYSSEGFEAAYRDTRRKMRRVEVNVLVKLY